MSGRIKKFLCSFIFQPKKIQRPFKAFTFSPPGDFWGSSVKDESSVNEPVFYSTGKSLFLKCPPVIVYSETVLLREFANLLSRAGVGFRESRSLHFYSSRKKRSSQRSNPGFWFSTASVFVPFSSDLLLDAVKLQTSGFTHTIHQTPKFMMAFIFKDLKEFRMTTAVTKGYKWSKLCFLLLSQFCSQPSFLFSYETVQLSRTKSASSQPDLYCYLHFLLEIPFICHYLSNRSFGKPFLFIAAQRCDIKSIVLLFKALSKLFSFAQV